MPCRCFAFCFALNQARRGHASHPLVLLPTLLPTHLARRPLPQGHLLYYGSAAAAADWFGAQGYTLPYRVSLPDFLLDLANGDVATDARWARPPGPGRNSLAPACTLARGSVGAGEQRRTCLVQTGRVCQPPEVQRRAHRPAAGMASTRGCS